MTVIIVILESILYSGSLWLAVKLVSPRCKANHIVTALILGIVATAVGYAPIPFLGIVIWIIVAYTYDLNFPQMIFLVVIMVIIQVVVIGLIITPFIISDIRSGSDSYDDIMAGYTKEHLTVESDHEDIAYALDMFFIDNNIYPGTLNQLTTPVQYLETIPVDPYTNAGYGYMSDGRKWVLASTGPDTGWDLNPADFLNSDIPAYDYLSHPNSGAQFVYDPTNGEISVGDIVTLGPDEYD